MTSAASSRLRRFFALRRREQLLLAEAWGQLLAAALRLQLAPRRALARALHEAPARMATGGEEWMVLELSRAVARAAAHHVRPMTCLPRALALRRMLATRGIVAAVRIGVRREGATVTAHAWVEVAGQAIGEPEAIEERFRVLLPPAGGADRQKSP